MAIRVVLHTLILYCASLGRLFPLKIASDDAVGVVIADVLHELLMPLLFVLPIINIIRRLLLLQTFKEGLILSGDSLRFNVSGIAIERFSNGLGSSATDGAQMLGLLLLRLEMWDRRHVAFLMLREVATLSSEDTGHTFK